MVLGGDAVDFFVVMRGFFATDFCLAGPLASQSCMDIKIIGQIVSVVFCPNGKTIGATYKGAV